MKSIFVGTLLAVQSLYLKTILAPFYLARKALWELPMKGIRGP